MGKRGRPPAMRRPGARRRQVLVVGLIKFREVRDWFALGASELVCRWVQEEAARYPGGSIDDVVPAMTRRPVLFVGVRQMRDLWGRRHAGSVDLWLPDDIWHRLTVLAHGPESHCGGLTRGRWISDKTMEEWHNLHDYDSSLRGWEAEAVLLKNLRRRQEELARWAP